MPIQKLNPYLIFNGNAEKAIQLYEKALGARTEGLSRFGDVPGSRTPPEHRNRVVHAELHLGEDVVMVSDSMPEKPVPTEGNVHVCLDFDDALDMTRRFEALADGGKVTMPLQDMFWGARFGMLTDAFGVNWMFNCTHRKPS